MASTSISEFCVEVSTPESVEVPRKATVNGNDSEIGIVDSEKTQTLQQPSKKVKIIRFIAFAHKAILDEMKLKAKNKNISIGDQVHNILFTSYNDLKQRYNKTNGTLIDKSENTDYKVTFDGREVSLSRDKAHALVMAEAEKAELTFKEYQQNDPENWYPTASYYLNFLSGHALRRRELRLGHNTMVVNKKDGQKQTVKLSQYGIYSHHHILCEGVTFPPEKRSSMPQSLGPLTALLCYLKSGKMSSEKWVKVVKKAMAHFPEIDSILSKLRERDLNHVRIWITMLADVALMSTNRQESRMFPAPAMFSYIFTRETHKIGNSIYKSQDLLENFSFSGKGAFAFYKIVMSTTWSLYLNKETNTTVAKQIVFHSLFGTYKEDLGILSQITDQNNWLTRENMRSVFPLKSTRESEVEFEPVQLKYYFKLEQTNQTDNLNNNRDTPLSSISCLSGYYSARSLLQEPTFKCTCGRPIVVSLLSSYISLKEKLRNYIEKDGRATKMRAISLYSMDLITPILSPVDPVDLVMEGTGKFFLGRIYLSSNSTSLSHSYVSLNLIGQQN